MTNHPITPPPELVRKIFGDALRGSDGQHDYELRLIHAAYASGADQELEACIEWLIQRNSYWEIPRSLRAALRPKPPSLKAQALKMLRPLRNPVMTGTPEYRLYEPQAEIIRRALEALDD
jgi:hypothetical protein